MLAVIMASHPLAPGLGGSGSPSGAWWVTAAPACLVSRLGFGPTAALGRCSWPTDRGGGNRSAGSLTFQCGFDCVPDDDGRGLVEGVAGQVHQRASHQAESLSGGQEHGDFAPRLLQPGSRHGLSVFEESRGLRQCLVPTGRQSGRDETEGYGYIAELALNGTRQAFGLSFPGGVHQDQDLFWEGGAGKGQALERDQQYDENRPRAPLGSRQIGTGAKSSLGNGVEWSARRCHMVFCSTAAVRGPRGRGGEGDERGKDRVCLAARLD